jgi:hypothetical protein
VTITEIGASGANMKVGSASRGLPRVRRKKGKKEAKKAKKAKKAGKTRRR